MSERAKRLLNYIFPAVGGMFATYLYNVVDGVFVGQGVGAAALGAVNIGVPFITFVVAAAAMFPMGGATVVAIRMGRGDKKGANDAFIMSLTLTFLISAALMAFGMIFAEKIVDLSGAVRLSAEMRKMAADYLFYYSAFSIPMLMSTCLSVFVRNDGSPGLSFAGMCAGAAANIFLDWPFIFPFEMGVIGAAVASGLGQILSVAVLLVHFIKKRGILRVSKPRFDLGLIKKICKRGIPEAVSQLTTPVTALCYNITLAALIGDIGVSTFSVLSFIYSLANAVLSGVTQGLQPIWGNCYGRRDQEEMKWFFKRGMAVNFVLGTAIYTALAIFDRQVISIFNSDSGLVETASAALPIFALSFIPMGLNLIYTAFMFSTKRTGQANITAISRGVVVKAAAIFCLPVLFGEGAVWTAPLAAEIITLVLAAALNKRTKIEYK